MYRDAVVCLAPFERDDLPAVLAWVNDRELCRALNRVLPVTLLEHERWYERLILREDAVTFAIRRLASGAGPPATPSSVGPPRPTRQVGNLPHTGSVGPPRPTEQARAPAVHAAPAVDGTPTVHAVRAPAASGDLIGLCGLSNIEARHRRAELWLYIGPPEARGQGLGSGAVRLLVAFGFEQLNLGRIHLYLAAYNEPARRVYEACGFREEGRDREHLYLDGQYHDALRMGLLRREHEAPGEHEQLQAHRAASASAR